VRSSAHIYDLGADSGRFRFILCGTAHTAVEFGPNVVPVCAPAQAAQQRARRAANASRNAKKVDIGNEAAVQSVD